MAPPYSCLGMGEFEKIVKNSNNSALEKILIWRRFIDDIWSLFKGSEEEAKLFVNFLNSLMPGVIKFTFEFSEDKINFLDITMKFVNENGKVKIETELFIKESNKQLFLDFTSNHPMHSKKSIVYSQGLRYLMLCSNQQDLQSHLSKLRDKFKEVHYPESINF